MVATIDDAFDHFDTIKMTYLKLPIISPSFVAAYWLTWVAAWWKGLIHFWINCYYASRSSIITSFDFASGITSKTFFYFKWYVVPPFYVVWPFFCFKLIPQPRKMNSFDNWCVHSTVYTLTLGPCAFLLSPNTNLQILCLIFLLEIYESQCNIYRTRISFHLLFLSDFHWWSPHNLHETNSHIGRIVSFCQCWAENNDKKALLETL